MRISSIDIGSNAIRQLIAEISLDGTWKVLKKHRENIRLGADVFNGRVIKPPTQLRLIQAFKRMSRFNKKYKVDRSLAYATSAFRDAQNKKLILSAIYKTSGIRIKVISGLKEAHLIRQAVQSSIGLTNQKCLLIDIGGGSIELTEIIKNKIHFSKSYKWGMVRMLSESKKLNISAENHLKNKMLKEKKSLPHGTFDIAVGTGGNIDAISKLKLLVLKKGPNTVVTLDEVQKLYSIFTKTPIEMRMSRFKIKADRVDVLEPALFLVMQLMKQYEIKKMKIPGVGLKEGAILSLL
jgi:exopolyphosphatase/guanosine-5'-triphosphate,3'-diphosphate pyrophosphatase